MRSNQYKLMKEFFKPNLFKLLVTLALLLTTYFFPVPEWYGPPGGDPDPLVRLLVYKLNTQGFGLPFFHVFEDNRFLAIILDGQKIEYTFNFRLFFLNLLFFYLLACVIQAIMKAIKNKNTI